MWLPLALQDGKGIKRSGHKRRFIRKPVDSFARNLGIVKQYLHEIGLTWPLFARVHARHAFGKSTDKHEHKVFDFIKLY